MWAFHSLRNCALAAEQYTLPIAAPRALVLSVSAETAPLTSGAFRLPFAATAVCTTKPVAATCWMSSPVSAARSADDAAVTWPDRPLEETMPLASTWAVPFMCMAAISMSLPAAGLFVTMALMAVSRVDTWPCRSAATADLGSLVAPATNAENWLMYPARSFLAVFTMAVLWAARPSV